MSNISNASMAALAPKEVLDASDKFIQKVVMMAAGALDVELAIFFWVDSETGCLRVTHSCDREGIGLESLEKNSVEAFCVKHKDTVIINEPKTDPRAQASALSALSNVLCSPIMLNEEVFGVLMVANKIKITPPFAPVAFNSRDEDVVQYFSAVVGLGVRLYAEFFETQSAERNITTLLRMLSHTSLQNLDEAAAAVQLENFDYFLPPSRLSISGTGSRPVSKTRQQHSARIEEGSNEDIDVSDLLGAPPNPAVRPPFLSRRSSKDPLNEAQSSRSLAQSIRSIDSFYRNETDDKDEDLIGAETQGDDRHLQMVFHSFNTGSSTQSRTASQLRLITLSSGHVSMENVVGRFGNLYLNLLNSTSLSHLMDEAQTTVKEFLGATYSYICHMSAENGGSLVISSPQGDSIMNLADLPREVISALDWGIVTELLTAGSRPLSQGRSPSDSLRIPGVVGTTALIVPLRVPHEFDLTETDEYVRSSEMSRLLIITKFGDRFSAFERDSVELFAKILSESAAHVAFRDSRGDIHVHNKIQMLESFSHLERPFSLLLSFDGYFLMSSRDLTDVFGPGAARGHFTSWIGSSNEQLLRDITSAVECERSVAREDYLLTTPAAVGGGLALDYAVLPLVDSYYSCNCVKCSSRGSVSHDRSSSDSIEKNVCLRKLRGGSFVVITGKASSQSMVDFRSFCRTPSSNPAGWFDEVDSPSLLSADMRKDVITLAKRSRSRASDVGGQNLGTTAPAPGSVRVPITARSRSYSDVEGDVHASGNSSPDKSCLGISKEARELKSYTMTTTAEEICTWGLNVLKIESHGLLRRLIYQVFSLAVDFKEVSVDPKVFHDYVKEVSSMYNQVIFHNFYHAACITHVTFMLLRETSVVIELSKPLKFGLLLSALVHDIHHPGNTNLFEINSKSALAILYNDQSVLENHHCATAFRLMTKPGLEVLGNMSTAEQRDIRKLMVASIMATDMSKHSDLMEETAVRANHPASWNTAELSEQIFYSKIILHAADLSNPTRDFPVAFEWAKLIAAEFNEQTKLETALGLPVLSFMVSPDDVTIVKNELSFSTFVVAPMWRGLAKLFPQLSGILDCLSSNAEQYSDLLEDLENKAAADRIVSETKEADK